MLLGVFINGMGKRFAWLGSFVAFVPLAITFFYTVVVGWCIYYFIYVTFNPLPQNFDSSMIYGLHTSKVMWPVVTHAVAAILWCTCDMEGDKIN